MVLVLSLTASKACGQHVLRKLGSRINGTCSGPPQQHMFMISELIMQGNQGEIDEAT